MSNLRLLVDSYQNGEKKAQSRYVQFFLIFMDWLQEPSKHDTVRHVRCCRFRATHESWQGGEKATR